MVVQGNGHLHPLTIVVPEGEGYRLSAHKVAQSKYPMTVWVHGGTVLGKIAGERCA